MPMYTRVKDKRTGHEYDVLAHKFDPEKHARVNRKHWPDAPRPRPAKPNRKNPKTTPTTGVPVNQTDDAHQGTD